MTIGEFADFHGLEMLIQERRLPKGNPTRYWAEFKGAEIMGDGVLIGEFGNGATHEEAIADYAKKISLKRIVIGVYRQERKEIEVPRLKG